MRLPVTATFAVLLARCAPSGATDASAPRADAADRASVVDAGAPDAVPAPDAPEVTPAPDAPPDAPPNPHRATISRAADAILAHQASDGAIFTGPTSLADNRLVPYFGNLAASALCLAHRETGDARYLDAATRWLDWYAAHQNTDGTVFDYVLSAGALSATGDFDSTDSYAATFVDAVRVCRDELPDPLAARGRMPAVRAAVAAIDLTYQPDALTFAKPGYAVAYLMDNVEVRLGLAAAAALTAEYGTATDADALAAQAARTFDAIDRLLYLPAASRYAYALAGSSLDSMPGQWYPDTMAQLMAVAWLPPSPRRAALYAALRGSVAFNVPAAIGSDQDGEYAVWWGMAARAAGDEATRALVAARFDALDFARVLLRTPADYGHVIRILAR